ncbi:uncharacterized protein BX663DRAFT_499784 [Cokeromyces recurvatus]|uniref:uncharacterized protein n=1 Tax=Cokeromyces recurvatus TaxID=90255 RepID=UPI00221F5D22|nr:uncharacterized protein BX663DRAFT_499784 [Cokeromyces recurvatus]KAI7905458.1 hypothetical protein BX663DRAFT_499784 [Cokeromyces recurvatus]
MMLSNTTKRFFNKTVSKISFNPFITKHKISSVNIPPPQPKLSKTRQFIKKYGYVGLSVYLIIGAIDLSTTMAVISIKGADRVKEAEHYVTNKVKNWIGLSTVGKKNNHELIQQQTKPSLTSIFVIAYGIHKTILLPLRLSLTAAITPAVVRKLTRLGWLSISKK